MNPTNKPVTRDRSPEIEGGIKNGLSRGENIQSIKQSFVNAGYKPEEVDKAIANVSHVKNQNQQASKTQISNHPKPLPITKKPIKDPYKAQEKQSTEKPMPQQTKIKKPHKFIKWIILGVVVVLILTIAGILGLYWKEIIKMVT